MAHPIYGNMTPAWVYALRVCMALFITSAPYAMVIYLTKEDVVPQALMWTPPCQQPKLNITKRKMRAYVRALVEKLSLAH